MLLGDVTLVATYRQLARWTERGRIKRVRTGRYAAITQIPSCVTSENANYPALSQGPSGVNPTAHARFNYTIDTRAIRIL
ncbi:hypothetical protein [Streptomyces sp. NPDC050422]|uniref:hypothetical protein n=1 Tax=Streptomyces sp. NPDC050422 TaxID=3365614 RepID=UPI0037B7707C